MEQRTNDFWNSIREAMPDTWRAYRLLTLDLVCVNLSLAAGVFIAANLNASPDPAAYAATSVVLSVVAGGLLLWRRVYRISSRYFGLHDFLQLAAICAAIGATQFALLNAMHGASPTVSPTVATIFSFLTSLCLFVGLRVVARLRAWQHSGTTPGRIGARRTLIVGAGDAAEMMLRELTRHPEYGVVGLVDDDPSKQKLAVHGVRVLGTTQDLPQLIGDRRIDEVLLAIPSMDGGNMRRIVTLLQDTPVRVRTLPALSALLGQGPVLFNYLREVDIEDLLRREPIRCDIRQTARYLSGETVVITGGGGSIGSELARQIARLAPANLILLGRGENSLYAIEQELIQEYGVRPTLVVADVRDRQALHHAFQKFKPSIVFHAAAHKHVPMMESNPIEAARNNVLGTWNAAEASIRHGAKKFIYVSTDKAVHPSSVMGATKRIGEMIVASMAKRSETDFAVVRFGNVLGSRGSLVPVLKAQIKRGGPVRVTHKEMTRYFMTIPEAVQLIMTAGAMGQNGEIFILNMGEPIKIIDLVNDLIRLHGLVPGADIAIEYTGIRPGEKLHEELTYEAEDLLPSAHQDIRQVANGKSPDWDELRKDLEKLIKLADEGDELALRNALMSLAWNKQAPPISMLSSTEG